MRAIFSNSLYRLHVHQDYELQNRNGTFTIHRRKYEYMYSQPEAYDKLEDLMNKLVSSNSKTFKKLALELSNKGYAGYKNLITNFSQLNNNQMSLKKCCIIISIKHVVRCLRPIKCLAFPKKVSLMNGLFWSQINPIKNTCTALFKKLIMNYDLVADIAFLNSNYYALVSSDAELSLRLRHTLFQQKKAQLFKNLLALAWNKQVLIKCF